MGAESKGIDSPCRSPMVIVCGLKSAEEGKVAVHWVVARAFTHSTPGNLDTLCNSILYAPKYVSRNPSAVAVYMLAGMVCNAVGCPCNRGL